MGGAASGVHATLAGVAVALTMPLDPTPGRPEAPDSPLHPTGARAAAWVAFCIVPVFGFANAGVSLGGLGTAAISRPCRSGSSLGLFVGKQIGVFGAMLGDRSALASPTCPPTPAGRSSTAWRMLCGIGFTMSLFIGLLAFGEISPLASAVKFGVLAGSALSGLVGYALLRGARSDPAC